MENQKELSPNLFQEAAVNIRGWGGGGGEWGSHLSIKQVHSSRQTTPTAVVVAWQNIQMWAGVQGWMTKEKQVSLVLLLMEQFVLAYKRSRKI